jgi:hypothetical protein
LNQARLFHLRTIVLALLVFLGGVTPATSWTAETRIKIVDDAVKLMPRSLRTLLGTHRKALLRGTLAAMATEGGPDHAPGVLPARVREHSDRLVQAVDSLQPFDSIAARFGELAHIVADAGFPPLATGEDGAGHYTHFAGFVEQRLELFPLVFYGHGDFRDEPLDRAGYIRQVVARSAENDVKIARIYAKAGNPPAAAFFDDRSIPFAVGSLSYSRTVNDIVIVWLDAWNRAHGDLGRTPYLKLPAKDTAN